MTWRPFADQVDTSTRFFVSIAEPPDAGGWTIFDAMHVMTFLQQLALLLCLVALNVALGMLLRISTQLAAILWRPDPVDAQGAPAPDPTPAPAFDPAATRAIR